MIVYSHPIIKVFCFKNEWISNNRGGGGGRGGSGGVIISENIKQNVFLNFYLAN